MVGTCRVPRGRPDSSVSFPDQVLFGKLFGKSISPITPRPLVQALCKGFRQAIGKLKAYGIVLSGDAVPLGVGAMTDAAWKRFFDEMVATGLYPRSLPYKNAYDLRFVRAMPMNFQ